VIVVAGIPLLTLATLTIQHALNVTQLLSDLTRKAAGMERDKLLGTMDAKVWTDEFMATKARLGDEEFDHAMMLAWFANAIMAGFDEANRCAQRALDAAQARVKELELYLTQERANRDSLAACVDRDVKKIKELQA